MISQNDTKQKITSRFWYPIPLKTPLTDQLNKHASSISIYSSIELSINSINSRSFVYMLIISYLNTTTIKHTEREVKNPIMYAENVDFLTLFGRFAPRL